MLRSLATLDSKILKIETRPTSTAPESPLTGMNQYVCPTSSYDFHSQACRIWPSTSHPSLPCPPRSAVMLHPVSAKKLALPGTQPRSHLQICLADSFRFETREIAERVIREYHSVHNDHDDVKLFLRFADTKAQKQLKQQSQERRNWRSREYSFSVEHTPSPNYPRMQSMHDHISPNGSYQSPANGFTPATSVSPP